MWEQRFLKWTKVLAKKKTKKARKVREKVRQVVAGKPFHHSFLSRVKSQVISILPSFIRRRIIHTHPWIKKIILITLLALVLLGALGVYFLLKELPSPRKLAQQDQFAASSQIFDRHGTLLYEIFADTNRIPVSLSQLPPYVSQATIAIEDKNFYKHFGFDVVGILRAVKTNITGDKLAGGSTITQQLVKNTLLSKERTFKRKIKEFGLSILTEILYSKQEILEMYLNHISYGGTAVGIEAASKMYFNKHAKDLTLAEAALLAGLPQAPSRYSPFQSDATAAKNRQLDVLRRMVEDGYITKEQADKAGAEPLNYALSVVNIRAPHFVFYVRDLLYDKYGVETVEKGGLRITTTLDLPLQDTVQASLSAELKSLQRLRVSNGAAMVVKPNTGEILAMIGSKDYFNATAGGKVNVAIAQRQPGSSVKPLTYATAFQQKLLNPGSVLVDTQTCFDIPGQKAYCPKNYDGSFHGPVTVRSALANSYNIPAVKALKTIGLETFIAQASAMGITTWTDPSQYGLALTLGGGEVKMIDMAQAFSVLADQGVKVPLTPFIKVEDLQGKVLIQTNADQRRTDLEYLTLNDDIGQQNDLVRVMDRAPAYMVSHIMQDNVARTPVFTARSKLVIPNQIVSVKTGTTNNLKDNWTVGFTPEFLTITWVGNNDGSPMNQALVSGVTGAAPIWNDIMSFILKDQKPVWQEKPLDVKSAVVCPHGFPKQEGEDCQQSGSPELYWSMGMPSKSSYHKEQVWIDPNTGQPPPPGVQVDGLVLEEHTFYEDPVTDRSCVDCRPTPTPTPRQ